MGLKPIPNPLPELVYSKKIVGDRGGNAPAFKANKRGVAGKRRERTSENDCAY